MKYLNMQKGVSLYIAVMIIVILLAIVLGAGTILLGQLKVIKGMENSIAAFYAADSGIERVLMERNSPNTDPGYYNGSVGDATYEVTVLTAPAPYNYYIRSVGSYKGTKRAIEVVY